MEQLYTIPVNEAFDADTECPICAMRKALEDGAIDFTMGPSYMEDDVRMETDRIGFCGNHIKLMYQNQNRLGLGLMLLTHMERTTKDLKKLSESGKSAGGLFKKKETSAVKEYIDRLESSCYICNRINRIFDRYIATVFYLYQKDPGFVQKFKSSKGFCISHYGLLYEEAAKELSGSKAEEFRRMLNQVYLDNMQRVRDDLEWFTDKFDYRYVNEPWKNSKDALIRSALKMNSVVVEEKK
ncbi:MAG: hypothetical protein J6B85_03885 [Lachnospiraceae bacterium]|nr:hypothetical protein [Lachnospiraceae bacterium]